MSQILTLRRLIAASGFATVAAVTLMSMSGQASASVADCRGRSPNDVLKCCQEEVSEHGRPDWMRSNHVNCGGAGVACRSSANGNYTRVSAVAPGTYNKCRIIVLKPIDRDSHSRDNGGKTSRGTNGNTP